MYTVYRRLVIFCFYIIQVFIVQKKTKYIIARRYIHMRSTSVIIQSDRKTRFKDKMYVLRREKIAWEVNKN